MNSLSASIRSCNFSSLTPHVFRLGCCRWDNHVLIPFERELGLSTYQAGGTRPEDIGHDLRPDTQPRKRAVSFSSHLVVLCCGDGLRPLSYLVVREKHHDSMQGFMLAYN